MPRYEFNCQSCGNKFIVAISIAERDKVKCPECGSKNIKQLFSPVSVGKDSGGDNCNTCGSRTFG
ncbi:FmdB family regulatory protein [Thermincola ferriacetica]|uniref:Regulatory protein, FmdB family n=2 Tax=Thermincola TaxID=278993 RepID=D5X890_THEPJ|nr:MULTISPECIES: zinc ribbon domain-containing protein [Thermincola]ADG82810.1 regulatory protein, FmdB family [Thermincola potens JR]KNZ70271.1 FmdB family regulatory protein [Thermincola ferriacetica]